MKSIVFLSLLFFSFQFTIAQSQSISKIVSVIEVENPISLRRTNETITLCEAFLKKAFPHKKVLFIEVKDLKTNTLLVTQAIDDNADGIPEAFLFQTDFQANEKKEFAIMRTAGATMDTPKVYATYMSSKEGMEDFTWENDLIGYRFYGQERAKLQGTGIAMDIWCKRVPEFLTEKWYIPGQSYHKDTGYGADHYNSGKNQGCGGTGIMKNDSIYFSKPFHDWKIIANGPIRVVFELKFTGWTFNKDMVETKRVTFDAGQYFNKIESRYDVDITSLGYQHTVSFVQRDDSEAKIEKDLGWFTSWESLGVSKGNLGTAFMALPSSIVEIKNKNKHLVALIQPESGNGFSYYIGAVWDQFGTIPSNEAWKVFVANKADCIKNPCTVILKKR